MGLSSIYLCLSYFKGLLTKIPCNGHTNCSGTNGAGKTTALQLIPVFYGANPESLVKRAGGKSSFLEHYLPSAQSMVVFEYQRDDGPYCSVMFRHKSGARAVYRFLKGSAEEHIFTPYWVDRLSSGMSANDVLNEIRKSGVQASGIISQVNEYRAIIQNDRKLASNIKASTRELIAYGREYSVAGASGEMSQMNDLTYAILKRSNMMERLKEMIIETQFTSKVPLRPDHTDNKNLPSNLSSLRAFEKAEPELRKCIHINHARLESQNDILVLSRQLAVAVPLLQERVTTLENAVAEIDAKSAEISTEYQRQHAVLVNRQTSAKANADQAERSLDALDNEKLDWESKNISEKKGELSNIATLEAQAESAKDLYGTLQSEAEGIEEWLNNSLQKIDATLAASTLKADQDKYRLNGRAAGIKAEALAECNAVEKELSAAKLDGLAKHHEAMQPLTDERIRLQGRIDSTSQNEEESLREAAAFSQEENAVEALDKAEGEEQREKRLLDAAGVALTAARSLHDLSVEEHLKRANERGEIDDVLSPGEKTLLSSIRRLNPQWHEDFGKIIDPALLRRSDLNPSFVPTEQGSVFGITLALDQIESPRHAVNETILREQLAVAIEQEKAAERKLETTKQAVLSAQTEFNTAEKNHLRASEEVRKAKADLTRSRQHREDVRRDIASNVAGRKLQCKTDLQSLESRIAQMREQHETYVQRLTDNAGEQLREIGAQRDIALSEVEAEISQVNASQDDAIATANAQKARAAAAHKEKCTEAGVSNAMLTKAREEKTRTAQKVSIVNGYRADIEQYDRWVKIHWNGRSKLVTDCNRYTEEVEKIKAEIHTLAEQSKVVRHEHATQRAQYIRDKNAQLELLNDSQAVLKKAMATPAPTPVSAPEDIGLAIKTLNDRLDSHADLHKAVLKHVTEANRMLSGFRDSQISEAWMQHYNRRLALLQDTRPDMHEAEEVFLLSLSEDLEFLLQNDVPHIRSAIVSVVRTLAAQIEKYYDGLAAVGSETEAISRRLKKQINTNQQIPALSDISLSVISKVESIGAWDELKAFKRELESWSLQARVDLPPDSLVQSLSDVISVLDSGHVHHDLTSLVDIEISLYENGQFRSARRDEEVNNLGSNGLSYLAVIVIFIGMARHLCPDPRVNLTWPVDEIASLDVANVSLLFDMLKNSGIKLFAAMPTKDTNFLRHFDTRVVLDFKRGASIMADLPPGRETIIDKLRATKEEPATL